MVLRASAFLHDIDECTRVASKLRLVVVGQNLDLLNKVHADWADKPDAGIVVGAFFIIECEMRAQIVFEFDRASVKNV